MKLRNYFFVEQLFWVWLKNCFSMAKKYFPIKLCNFHEGKELFRSFSFWENLKNIASHFSRVFRLKQKQNHLSLFTSKKFDGMNGEKFFLVFARREEKYHKFGAFFNEKKISQEWQFQCSIDKSASSYGKKLNPNSYLNLCQQENSFKIITYPFSFFPCVGKTSSFT